MMNLLSTLKQGAFRVSRPSWGLFELGSMNRIGMAVKRSQTSMAFCIASIYNTSLSFFPKSREGRHKAPLLSIWRKWSPELPVKKCE